MTKDRSLLLETARWAVVVVAIVYLLVLFGGSKTSEAAPADVAAAVTASVDMTNMLEADNQMIKRLYDLDINAYESCILYYPATNMMAEELLLVKLSDESQQETVRAAVEARLETQKTTFEGYGVEQFDLLTNHYVLELRGNYVLFVVSKDCSAAQQAFLDAL